MNKENYNNLKVLSGRFSTIVRFVDDVRELLEGVDVDATNL